MSLRLNPSEPTHTNREDASSSARVDQRVFPRIKSAKPIELFVGQNSYSGRTYDISQGGLSFIATGAIGIGDATIRISAAEQVFHGKILARHSSEEPGLSRFHFQFIRPLELTTLAGILGS